LFDDRGAIKREQVRTIKPVHVCQIDAGATRASATRRVIRSTEDAPARYLGSATGAQMPNYYGIPNYYVVRRIIVCGIVLAVAVTEFQNPTICPAPGLDVHRHYHIEQRNDAPPIQQQDRTVATSTSSTSGPRTHYMTLTLEQGSSVSVAPSPFRST